MVKFSILINGSHKGKNLTSKGCESSFGDVWSLVRFFVSLWPMILALRGLRQENPFSSSFSVLVDVLI